MSQVCNFATKSNLRCSFPCQTLEDLEKGSMKIPGKHMKISWLILSRIGIHYLSSNFGSWTICQSHRKEFLDAWQVPCTCTHPDHIQTQDSCPPSHLVNIIMSVKLLQSESKVVPISSKFCSKCFNAYNDKYSGKPGERLLVIVPKPKPITSPFALDPPSTSTDRNTSNHGKRKSNSRFLRLIFDPFLQPMKSH